MATSGTRIREAVGPETENEADTPVGAPPLPEIVWVGTNNWHHRLGGIKPAAICCHTTWDMNLDNVIQHFRNPHSWASSTFVIDRGAAPYQMMGSEVAPWTHGDYLDVETGAWNNPNHAHPLVYGRNPVVRAGRAQPERLLHHLRVHQHARYPSDRPAVRDGDPALSLLLPPGGLRHQSTSWASHAARGRQLRLEVVRFRIAVRPAPDHSVRRRRSKQHGRLEPRLRHHGRDPATLDRR